MGYYCLQSGHYFNENVYSKTCVERPLSKRPQIGLMQVKSIAEGEYSAILSTFITVPFAIKIFILSIFEWPFYTGFTVLLSRVSSWRYTSPRKCYGNIWSIHIYKMTL